MMDTHCLTHQEALEDLVQLFGIDDDRIRDPCIEYWAQLVSSYAMDMTSFSSLYTIYRPTVSYILLKHPSYFPMFLSLRS